MKIMNLKKDNEIKIELMNLIYDNFNNYSLSSLNQILSFIDDDLIELIENNDEFDDELIEIYNDDIKDIIKDNIFNWIKLYNQIPIYENDELINIVNINTFKKDKYDLIQYKTIINILKDNMYLIYELNNYELYDIEFDDDNFIIYYYNYVDDVDDKYILKLSNNKFKLLEYFYNYINPIVENIVDEIDNEIKYYFKYHQ